MRKIILTIMMMLFLTGIASSLEVQIEPKVVFFSENVGFDIYGNVRYDLGNFWSQVKGLEAGLGVGYSYINIEDEDINIFNIGGLISYYYPFADRVHSRVSLFAGTRTCYVDEFSANFMLLPSIEAGYEVTDDLIVGASLGFRIAFCEENERSIPLGIFVSYRL